MESAGFITLLYIMYALPKELGIAELSWGNWTMAGCFVRLLYSLCEHASQTSRCKNHISRTDCV
jgi:hypothetical protein